MSFTQYDHPLLVRTLCKPGHEIHASLTDLDCHLLHMSSKLCSEAGELMDAVGKAVYYRKPLDLLNIKEELGDIEFYLEGLRQSLNIPREETLALNISKLETRYPSGSYSNLDAQERKDKHD